MNWNNYGKMWHIDHVIPITQFNINKKEEIYKAFRWTNCRAEYKNFNLEKQNKIIPQQVIKHFEKIKKIKELLQMEICNQAT